MGILDSVIGSLFGGSNNNNAGQGGQSGIGGILSSILAGEQTGGTQGAAGGLGGLVSQFQQAGLGNVVQSWIGNGQNQSVSPGDLQNVFGDKTQGMAEQAGMSHGDFLDQLSQHLPNVINGMTPNGRVDDQGSVNV